MKGFLTKICIYFLFGIVCLFSHVGNVLARVYGDDFSGNLDMWEKMPGNTVGHDYWYISEEELVGEANWNEYSFLRLITESELDNFLVEMNMENRNGVDCSIRFRASDDLSDFYQVDFRFDEPDWSEDNNEITLLKMRDGEWSYIQRYEPEYSLTQNQFHKVKLEVVGEVIKVFFDGVKVIDAVDNEFSFGDFVFTNWAGSFNFGTVVNHIDNFILDDLKNVSASGKYIILPGLGGSWNGRAMVYGDEVEAEEWKMTPFVKVYDQLILGFEQNGLVRDKDFFVWNYDWRKPVADIVTDLDTFIDQKAPSETEEVNLVGHSLGGLVVRMWAQDNNTDSRLGKVMSLGSPHFGVLDAYDVWSGAKFADGVDLESVFLNVFLTLKRKGGETRLETIRGFAPVLKDLLPVFDFAKSKLGVIPYQSMETVNNYLISKNENVSLIFDKFMALVAEGGQAKRWINLRRRMVSDWFLGLWPEGRPMSYEYAIGDGRVLFESAKFDGDEFKVIDSNHGGMVTEAVNEVMNYFGLDQVTIGENNVDFSGKLVFYLGSPAEMRVDCGAGWVDDTDGFVLVDKGNCKVEILGTDDGRYHLVIGRVGGDDWQYFESEIEDDELIGFEVNEKGQIISNGYFWDLITKELKSLLERYPRDRDLLWSIKAAENKYLPLLRWRVAVFAQRHNEREVGDRILDYCRVLAGRRWWF